MKLCRLLTCAALMLSVAATAQPSNHAKRARELEVKNTVDQIRRDCGITGGQFSYSPDVIRLIYDGMIEREKLDCASDRATLLGIDFDTYDTSAPYTGPRRFIVKGPAKRLDVVAAEAVAARWTIIRRADARDGVAFIEIETGEKLSRREVRHFLDRFIGGGNFADVAVGLAPWTLAGYDFPAPAVVFRSHARHMYEDLHRPSCGTPPRLNHDALLKPARDAVLLLERELASSNTAPHLVIAREDATYRLSKESGCWNDSDLQLAKRHVGMVHQRVSATIPRLRALVPAVDPLPLANAPASAAEFRYHVWQLIEWTLPLCSLTTAGSNDEIFAAALAHVRAFEDRLSGTPYAVHYEIAKDDATYQRSRVTAECDDPDAEPVSKLSAEALASARKQTAELEKRTLPLK